MRFSWKLRYPRTDLKPPHNLTRLSLLSHLVPSPSHSRLLTPLLQVNQRHRGNRRYSAIWRVLRFHAQQRVPRIARRIYQHSRAIQLTP